MNVGRYPIPCQESASTARERTGMASRSWQQAATHPASPVWGVQFSTDLIVANPCHLVDATAPASRIRESDR